MQKILNRGNKLKDLLQTQGLAFFGGKNEPKTNSIVSAKEADQSEKTACRRKVSGDRG
jgi:hypothetical protein